MYHIHAHKQRNAQPALLNGQLLQCFYLVYALQVEHASNLSGLYLAAYFRVLGLSCGYVACHLKVKLTNLLVQSHARHEAVNKLIHLLVLRAHCPGQQQCRRSCQYFAYFHHMIYVFRCQ